MFTYPQWGKGKVLVEFFCRDVLQLLTDDGHLCLGHVSFTDFPEGGDDEGHQVGFVGEGAHLRGMFEEDAAAFADGDAPGRAVGDEHYVGGNLDAQAQPVEGIRSGGCNAYAVPFSDGLGNLIHGRKDDASTPAFIDTGITIYTLRYAREDSVLAQAHEG